MNSKPFFKVAGILGVVLLCAIANATASAQNLGKTDIQFVDGKSISAAIESVDDQGKVTGQGVESGTLLQDILSIRTGRSVNEDQSKLKILPAGGGQIFSSEVAIANEVVKFRGLGGKMEVSLQSIRALVWSDSAAVKKAVLSPSKDNDQVVVQVPNGERVVDGILESVDAEFVSVNYKGESRKIALSKIKAIVIADLGLKRPAGTEVAVKLDDGSQVSGAFKQMVDGKTTVAIAGGSDVEFSASKVVQINVVSDRLLFLSDTDPIDVQERPLFALQLSWQKDRTVEKNPLRLTSSNSNETIEYKKGLGVQSYSQLAFANTREFNRFAATVGIDRETAGKGDCRMVVQGDGIELWSKRVKASDRSEKIEVDISGMKQIELIVYPGEGFDLGDHADWAEARFVKTK